MSIGPRVQGRFGEDPVVGRHRAQDLRPKSPVVGLAEQTGVGLGGDPGVAADLALKLAGGPAGVADEGADEGPRLAAALDGLVGGNADVPLQALVVGPPKGGKGQVLARDGSAEVDGDVFQGLEGLVLEKVADAVAGRMVEDQAEGAFVGGVVGQEDDRAVENPVMQRGVRQQDFPLQVDRRVGFGVAHGGGKIPRCGGLANGIPVAGRLRRFGGVGGKGRQRGGALGVTCCSAIRFYGWPRECISISAIGTKTRINQPAYRRKVGWDGSSI